MKNNAEEMGASAGNFQNRIAPVDAKLAHLDARIRRNKADLERTNAEITLKIGELLRRLVTSQ